MKSLLIEILLIIVTFHSQGIPHEVRGLKLESIKVPHVVVEGADAVMSCPFNLHSDRLYSVMWYKDHEEFYRFVPRNNPMQHSYQLEGFNVDMQLSDDRHVILKKVTLKASGVYRCEVSAEAPSFTSVHDEARMEVISLPEEDPEISGQESVYNVGDLMGLNCTSGRSYPPAKLEWFINDIPLETDFDYLPEVSGPVSSTTTLQLRLEPQHFSNGQMNVRCVATVGPIQSSARILPLLINHKETSLLVQARGSTASSTLPIEFRLWSLLFISISLIK